MPSDKASHKLTAWEWDGLESGCNLADGHAHQAQSDSYLEIVNSLPKVFLDAEAGNQRDIQHKFEEAFFKLAGQHSYSKLKPPLYQSACSLSVEVVANYLRQTHQTVAMLHPTFDNLADILKRHKVRLIPLEQSDIYEPEVSLSNLEADAIFLVLPNNPTGLDITRSQYEAIVNYCKKHNKLLIVDCSFRFYSSLTEWDQYELLLKSGIDFIVFEDTGKTWPTLELKIGITVCSDSLYKQLEDITNDFLLNVSPFIFSLLTTYIKSEDQPEAQRVIVADNKQLLVDALDGSSLILATPNSKLSVAWIKLPDSWRATDVCTWLGNRDIHVLPGSPFYWNDHNKGESYLRVALLRPTDKFRKAIRIFISAINQYRP